MKWYAPLIATSIVVATINLQGCLPLFAAGAGTATVATQSAASPLSLGTQVEDSTIKTKAVNVLSKYPALQKKSNVEIVVFNRIVLLLGQVPTSALKSDIANDISNINGVRVVYNQLTIGKPVTFGTYAKDAWITTKIKSTMLGKVNPTQFKVVTENGVVYILGYTDKADGEIASRIASKTTGVRQVIEAYSYIPRKQPAEIENATPGKFSEPSTTN